MIGRGMYELMIDALISNGQLYMYINYIHVVTNGVLLH